MDFKSFEIYVDVFGEKLKGIIVERSRGFTSWIKFGSLSLCCLLEGVEACCRGESTKRFVKSWEDGGRKFKLVRRANEADRFLWCSVVDMEAKKYYLVFPKEKGILEGWALLAEKLCSLRVLICNEPRRVFDFFRTESRVGASKGKPENSYVDAVKSRARRLGKAAWLQLGEKNGLSGRELLNRCLVRKWGESLVSAPNLSALGSWGRSHWNLKGRVKFARLGDPFILIEFENKAEVEKVLLRGLCCFKESFLYLEM